VISIITWLAAAKQTQTFYEICLHTTFSCKGC